VQVCSSLKLQKAYSVEVTAVPPYSFELTVNKPAGWWWSTPDEIFEDDTFWTATRFRNTLLGLKLKATGTPQKPKIQCTIFSQTELNSTKQQDITRMLKRALRTEEDLTEFYALAKEDSILKTVVEDLCGIRTTAWPELFPALILAVTLQMAPMTRANQMMELLISGFGDQAAFDGKAIRYWPSPDKIASSTVDDLMAKAKLGYRAKNLTAIAKTLQQGFPAMDDLWAMSAEEAKRKLLTLRGIGDYSADIIVPDMGFPIDVWSAKIFHILFFGTKPENPRQAIPLLKETAEKRWGKWQGYAFVYVLNDLPKLSKRIGVDLTQF
jgi:DNA-3-methyladenine glycosylase II